MKDAIKQMLVDGKSYDDIIQSVTEEVISQVLVKTRGNQTEAAEKLGMNRGTLRKYLTRMGEKVMKDHSKMSDFEINKEVAQSLGIDAQERNGNIFGGVDRKIDNVTSVIGVIDYCNNPSDAWPIMDEHKIGLVFVNTEWRASSALVGYREYSDTKAFRAAMIVYLMMKDEE